jgi:hypothetical protein
MLLNGKFMNVVNNSETTKLPPTFAHFNVVKHAGVEDAQVEVSKEGGRLSIAVSDRGMGRQATRLALV